MLDKFTKVQEKHEEFQMTKKLNEATLALNTDNPTNKPYSKSNGLDSYTSNTNRILSHDSTVSDKKDYFSHDHSVQAGSDPKLKRDHLAKGLVFIGFSREMEVLLMCGHMICFTGSTCY